MTVEAAQENLVPLSGWFAWRFSRSIVTRRDRSLGRVCGSTRSLPPSYER
jgi:hypothetical protein